MSFTTDPGQAADPNKPDPSFAADQQQQPPAEDKQDRAFLIVGERAFADRDSLVKHIASAQEHIKTLEAERAEDRQTIATLKEEVESLRKIADVAVKEPAPADQQVDPAKIAELAVSHLTKQQVEAQQAANLAAAVDRASKAYGEGYATKISELAAKRKLSLQEVDQMAKTNPVLFDELFLPVPNTSSAYQPGYDRSAANPPKGSEPDTRRNVMKMSEKERMNYVSGLINKQ